MTEQQPPVEQVKTPEERLQIAYGELVALIKKQEEWIDIIDLLGKFDSWYRGTLVPEAEENNGGIDHTLGGLIADIGSLEKAVQDFDTTFSTLAHYVEKPHFVRNEERYLERRLIELAKDIPSDILHHLLSVQNNQWGKAIEVDVETETVTTDLDKEKKSIDHS